MKPPERYCFVMGKISHINQNQARKQLASLKRAKSYPGQVYRCPYCGLFHVGRPRTKFKKRKLRRMQKWRWTEID